jgi:hypothetical protein
MSSSSPSTASPAPAAFGVVSGAKQRADQLLRQFDELLRYLSDSSISTNGINLDAAYHEIRLLSNRLASMVVTAPTNIAAPANELVQFAPRPELPGVQNVQLQEFVVQRLIGSFLCPLLAVFFEPLTACGGFSLKRLVFRSRFDITSNAAVLLSVSLRRCFVPSMVGVIRTFLFRHFRLRRRRLVFRASGCERRLGHVRYREACDASEPVGHVCAENLGQEPHHRNATTGSLEIGACDFVAHRPPADCENVSRSCRARCCSASVDVSFLSPTCRYKSFQDSVVSERRVAIFFAQRATERRVVAPIDLYL